MNLNDKNSEPIMIYGLRRSTAVPEDKGVSCKQQMSHQRPIILDPQRPGDRQRLARLLAAIAWRLAKEQAARDVVSSRE